MIDVEVALKDRGYTISIGAGLIAQAGARLSQLTKSKRVAVVTDENVAKLHLETLLAGLAGFAVTPIILPPGEGSKSFATLETLTDRLLELEVKRSDVVIAFGGGIIGDLTGFAASIVKRGMHFVQIPTTLLSMVDSSVGGKTGINTKRGKNLVGAFHQPLAVWADLALLQTLPAREMKAGYAEIVKYGLISDKPFYEWCEANAAKLLAGDADVLGEAVAQSCRAKAAVVAADEFETNDIRALLNLGHTFGHALEAETGFSAQLLHGEAVGIGMAQAFRFSARQGLAPQADADRLTRHLDSIGMWSRPAQAGIAADAAEKLVAHMLHDKKMTDAGLPFILARGIGESYVAKGVPLADVTAFLEADLQTDPVG